MRQNESPHHQNQNLNSNTSYIKTENIVSPYTSQASKRYHLLKMKICSLKYFKTNDDSHLNQEQIQIKGSIQTRVQTVNNNQFIKQTNTSNFREKLQDQGNYGSNIFNYQIRYSSHVGKQIPISNRIVILETDKQDILYIEVFVSFDQINSAIKTKGRQNASIMKSSKSKFRSNQNCLHFLLKFPLIKFYEIPFVNHSIQTKLKLLNRDKVDIQYKDSLMQGRIQLEYGNSEWGKLQIYRISAQQLTNTQVFGKMDPYFIIKNGVSSFISKAKQNSGQNAVWDQDFSFQVNHMTKILKIQVFDKDNIYDDKVGEAQINLLDQGILIQSNKVAKKKIYLKNGQLGAGTLLLEYRFINNLAQYTFQPQKQSTQEWHEEQNRNNAFLSFFKNQN